MTLRCCGCLTINPAQQEITCRIPCVYAQTKMFPAIYNFPYYSLPICIFPNLFRLLCIGGSCSRYSPHYSCVETGRIRIVFGFNTFQLAAENSTLSSLQTVAETNLSFGMPRLCRIYRFCLTSEDIFLQRPSGTATTRLLERSF